MVTEYQEVSLECPSLQLLPGVTTLKCEPPQLPQENPQEVSGPVPHGSAHLQEKSPRDKAAVPVFNPVRSQTLVKTEEETAQALATEKWPHLSLARRNLCGNSAQKTVTSLSLMSKARPLTGPLYGLSFSLHSPRLGPWEPMFPSTTFHSLLLACASRLFLGLITLHPSQSHFLLLLISLLILVVIFSDHPSQFPVSFSDSFVSFSPFFFPIKDSI